MVGTIVVAKGVLLAAVVGDALTVGLMTITGVKVKVGVNVGVTFTGAAAVTGLSKLCTGKV